MKLNKAIKNIITVMIILYSLTALVYATTSVTGVLLNQSSIELNIGDSDTLKVGYNRGDGTDARLPAV